MATPKFNKNLFLKAQKEAKDKEFIEVPDGVYIATLEKAFADYAKSNPKKYQVTFGWKIEDDEKYNGNYAWNRIALTDMEGADFEKGYEILAIVLQILKYEGDEEDINKVVESRIGTKARIEIKTKDDYQNLRIKRVISSPEGGEVVSTKTEVDANEIDSTPDVEESGVELAQGMKITLVDGRKCEIIALLDAKDSPNGKDSLMVKTPDNKAISITLDMIDSVEEPEELDEPDEVDEPEFVPAIGMNVTGKNIRGEDISGPIREIDEKEGIVKVSFNGVKTKCKISDIKAA